MPYLGNQPSSGGYHKLDNLTASATDTYALTLGGSAYYPATANQLMVSLNGVIQAPQDSFTISGSNIVFASTLSASDSIDFIMSFGDVYGVGTPADGTITNAKIQSMAASKLTGALPAIDGSALTGLSSNAGSEYFEVDLTTDQASLTDSSNVIVDFGGSGTVVYDTSSNFETANDAYLLDSSNGVYMISFSCGVASNSPITEQIIYAHAGVEVATDGSTYSAYKSGGSQMRDSATDSGGSLTLTGSFIYKATTATTKIRLKAFADNAGTSTWRIGSTAANIVQVTGSSDLANAKVTWMSVMRIA
jgi:hypothetical protein